MKSQAQKSFRLLPNKLIVSTLNGADSLASFLIRLGVSANAITLMAFFFGLGAGILFFLEKPFLAGILLFLCGLSDILDGKVAEKTNRRSQFGAIFDSALDRYSEFFIYLGLAAYFRNHWALWLTFFTLLGSTMVSYTRARAEGLGIECSVGVMQRAERIILLTLASFAGGLYRPLFVPAMITVLTAIALVSNFTAFQRIFFVRKVEKSKRAEKSSTL
jgi:phosphatidylglycerophosphate synthase